MLRELVHRAGNHGCLPGKLCKQGGDHSDQPEHSACSPLPFYSHHSRSIPPFCRDILGIGCTVREIDLSDLISGAEQVEEDRLVHALLTEFKVVTVYRRFGAVVCWNIVPAAAGTQDVQDAVEQAAGVASRSANVWLCWREVLLDNIPQIVVDSRKTMTPGII